MSEHSTSSSTINERTPLRGCVRVALDNYFAHLEGEEPTSLYQLLISEVERPLLEKVLHYTNGNQTRSALILGLSRGTLRKKMAQYGLLE